MNSFVSVFEWREPAWLWLALFPWGLLSLRQLFTGSLSKDFADRTLLPWALAYRGLSTRHQVIWRQVLLAFAWLMFAVALSGPRTAQTVYDDDQEHYGQLIVVMDVSRSMTADDIAPSRMQRAKLELFDLINRADQTRIALVVYAARPHMLIPLTADKHLLHFYAQQLRYGLLPTHGSDLRGALDFAARHFDSDSASKSILVISDGEIANDNAVEEQELKRTVTSLRQQDVSVFTLGIGGRKGAAIMADDGSWLSRDGEAVVSRLQVERLEGIASIGGGTYSSIRENDAEWRTLYDNGVARNQTGTALARGTGLIVWNEYYHWFLVPGILLWLAAYLRPGRDDQRALGITLLTTAIVAILPNEDLLAAGKDLELRAYQAYQKEAYQDAQQLYEGVPGFSGRMGEGSSSYQLGKYDQAIRVFVRATLDAGTDQQRADALLNLGNSYFKLSRYSDAAAVYSDALRYRPGDQNIARNLAYAKALVKKEPQRANELGRPGTGPRALPPPEGSDISGAGILLDKDAETKDTPLPPTGQNAEQPDSDLVRHGIRRAELADTRIEQSDDPAWTYDITTPDGVALEATAIQVDESVLWQRILEYEEDFPVLVETPYEIPGVQPW